MNLLLSPYFAQGYVVQSGNDALHTYLFELGKSNLVFLAEPTPCSFHFLKRVFKGSKKEVKEK